MKTFLFALYQASCLFASTEFIAAQSPVVDAARISEIRQATSQGAVVLLSALDAGMVPTIPSKWRASVIQRESEELGIIATQSRELGLRIAALLDREARQGILETPEPDEDIKQAQILLQLADRLAGAPSYGTVTLANRARDIAAVRVGRLVVNLGVHEKTLTTLFQMFPNDDRSFSEYKLALASEAPANSEFVAAKVAPWGQDQMIRAWEVGLRRGKDLLEASGQSNISAGEARSVLPELEAFFCDDEVSDDPVPRTVTNTWDRKHHYLLIVGFDCSNLKQIRTLFQFREVIKSFPLLPPKSFDPADPFYQSPTAAAFDVAWRPHQSKFGPIYSNAAAAYDSITRRTFVDVDSKETMQSEARKARKN